MKFCRKYLDYEELFFQKHSDHFHKISKGTGSNTNFDFSKLSAARTILWFKENVP